MRFLTDTIVVTVWLIGLVAGLISAPGYELLLTITIVSAVCVLIYYGRNFAKRGTAWQVGFAVPAFTALWLVGNAIVRLLR